MTAIEGLFNKQRKYGVDTRTIRRGSASTSQNSISFNGPSTIIRKMSPCFNCHQEGCLLNKCQTPKDWEKIKRSIAKFREERNAARNNRSTNFATQDELFEEYAIGLDESLLARLTDEPSVTDTETLHCVKTREHRVDKNGDETSPEEAFHEELKSVLFGYVEEIPPWDHQFTPRHARGGNESVSETLSQAHLSY